MKLTVHMSLSARTGRRRERPVAGQAKCVPTLAIEGTPCTRSFSLVNSATAVSGGNGVSGVDLCYRFSNCYGREPIGAGPTTRDQRTKRVRRQARRHSVRSAACVGDHLSGRSVKQETITKG